jgi:hypothetical protein
MPWLRQIFEGHSAAENFQPAICIAVTVKFRDHCRAPLLSILFLGPVSEFSLVVLHLR